MAKAARSIAQMAILAVSLTLAGFANGQNELAPEAPQPEVIQAYRKFWRAFEGHEAAIVDAKKNRYLDAWKELKEKHEIEKRQMAREEISKLKESMQSYRQLLSDHSNAPNAPFVAMNLASVLKLIGERLKESDPDAGVLEMQEAMSILRGIEADFPGFEHIEEVIYLRALILTDLGDRTGALAVWQQLALRGGTTIYTVHANIAVGDYQFKEERAAVALTYYLKAQKILSAADTMSEKDFESLRVEYRIAWAAYRASDLGVAIETGISLLEPGRHAKILDSKKKIERDAIELIGDSLFEFNDSVFLRATLKRRPLVLFAPAIGLRAIERYAISGSANNVIETAEFLAREFPGAREIPDILASAAQALKTAGDTRREIAVLSQLAMMLPEDSLWRSRYQADFPAINTMTDKAVQAAEVVAAHHYEYGMSSGSIAAFDAASMHYGLLISHEPNGPQSNQWRLKRAHCHYFADRLPEADRMYSELKTEFSVDPVILEVATYQLALTRDKTWRKAYADVEAKGSNPMEDPLAVEHLRHLEQSIEDYANRFPARSRAIDLLLVGAAADRDQRDYESANRFWQRALIAGANPAQRAIAIRGIIMAKVEKGETEPIMRSTANFLRLENWQVLGEGLRSELLGVLSKAVSDESVRLSQDGQALAAGTLAVAIAKEFPTIPDFDRIIRDGAYMIAIGGEWAAAEEAAGYYLKNGFKQRAADMVYLTARAQEYQMRFIDAAKSYLDMGIKYPEHQRTTVSIRRAETLAQGENDLSRAALAATILGDRAARREDKVLHYGRAAAYLQEAQDWEGLIAVAKKRMKVATSIDDRHRSELDIAKAQFATGQESDALKSIAKIAKESEQRGADDGDVAADVQGEANFILGEEDQRQFDDFVILEREGSTQKNIVKKSAYFEQMTSQYERAIKSGHPLWSSHARYQIADCAQRYSDELYGIPLKKDGLPTREAEELRNASKRFSAMARKYHGNNVLASSKAPAAFKNIEWVKKSLIKLSGTGGAMAAQGTQGDQTPTAQSLTQPYQWSL